MSLPLSLTENCPNCKESWDGGDILEVTTKLSSFMHKSPREIYNIVNKAYGYTTDNMKRFSSTLISEIEGMISCTCPKCHSVFDVATGDCLLIPKEFKDEPNNTGSSV